MISFHPTTSHLISWIPDHSSEVFYLSPCTLFPPEKAIRGGVPICWPWFANNNPGAKSHGFARDHKWKKVEGGEVNGRTVFQLQQNAFKTEKYPHQVRLTFIVEATDTLSMHLITENLGNSEIQITQALHSYFLVGNINKIKITGLDQVKYYDKVNDCEEEQSGFIAFEGETDRIYKASNPCTLIDPDLKRTIRVASSGCESTVIWNPGHEKSKQMPDMPDDGYLRMCCIEAANTHFDPVSIPAEGRHTLSQIVSVTSTL